MPKSYYDEIIGGLSLNLGGGGEIASKITNVGSERQYSKNKGNNQGIKISLQATVSKLLGDAIVYDKKERLLVLELDTVQDAVRALNVLPFGLGYKIYLLD
jgi:hypothetical protein